MKFRTQYLLSLAAFAGLALTAASANAASVAAASVTGGTTGLQGYGVGWSFTTTSTIYVTDLGKFDTNGGGLSATESVGLYNFTTGDLITSVNVTNSSTQELNGGYTVYYESIPTVTLPAGNYMVVTTDIGNDSFARNVTPTMATGITYELGRASTSGDEVLLPSASDYTTTGSGYYGANFKFDTVPEPSIALLAALGSLAMLRRQRS